LKLIELSKFLNCELLGDKNIDIKGITSPDNANKFSITLISKKVLASDKVLKNSGALLINTNDRNFFKDFNVLLSENPKLDFAKLSSIFMQSQNSILSVKKIDPVSHYFLSDESVIIGKNFTYGANLVIEKDVVIGNNVCIGHNVTLHKGVKIGSNIFIGSGTVIGSEGFGNVLDQNHNWVHMYHFGSVDIKDNVSIGANCTIDRGTFGNTIISKGVILDNQVHIAHNVSIGVNTAIAAKVGIAGSCNIGKRNMIGGMVGIVDHITTADDVIISATSTVNRDIMESGRYTGIMPISKHSSWKRIAFWITKLNKIVKKINLKKNYGTNEY